MSFFHCFVKLLLLQYMWRSQGRFMWKAHWDNGHWDKWDGGTLDWEQWWVTLGRVERSCSQIQCSYTTRSPLLTSHCGQRQQLCSFSDTAVYQAPSCFHWWPAALIKYNIVQQQQDWCSYRDVSQMPLWRIISVWVSTLPCQDTEIKNPDWISAHHNTLRQNVQ